MSTAASASLGFWLIYASIILMMILAYIDKVQRRNRIIELEKIVKELKEKLNVK